MGTENFNAFASRDFTAETIRKALLDDAINLVVVHGMPGVGKTTLIKAITKQMKEEQLFQEIVVVTVSQSPNLIKLQGDIAERLDLQDLGEDLSARAERLSERLNQDTKTSLVVLDDVWDRIELSEVRIPSNNMGNCCKVVFTTRDRAVCDKMEANSQIEVALLSEDDSWVLFHQKSGTVANLSVARELLNECKCLPLAIITVGLALRNKKENVCADALQQLRKSVFKGMSPVNSSIRLSYNFLESIPIRICFLFSCLFPEDHIIESEVLLSCMMGEKLLEDVDTYEEARGRLDSIVDKLVSSGLLWKDENGKIRMHDVVRDVAISIAMEEHGFIVKAGRNLRDWPDMELSNCKRLSIMHNSIEELPTFPIKAPHLRALFLNDNESLTKLPSNFFADMKCLMTLDISGTAFESLPSSLSCLQNLRTLLLNRTRLTNLFPIYKLERLEVLSLRYSFLIDKELPEEMRNLSNLKILALTATSLSNSIRPDLLSKLRRLEEFYVLERGYFLRRGSMKANIFPEVGSLSRLTSLKLEVHNPEFCHMDIPGPWENLTRFRIIVDSYSMDVSDLPSRSLWLSEIRGKQVANWVLVLLGRTNYLRIDECSELWSVTELGTKGMNDNLKSLVQKNCPIMECLVSNMGLFESNENAFSKLEVLRVEGMDAFVEICKGTHPPRLFQKLKTLCFYECDVLLTAVPCKLIQSMQNLESLTVRHCYALLYVLQPEAEKEESRVLNMSRISESFLLPIFPNLKNFQIDQTEIRYVFTMRVARSLLQLEQLRISNCSEMEVIFKYEDGEAIKCGEESKESAILPHLKDLSVYDAPKLKSFTTLNLVMELPSLECLELSWCGILERLPFGPKSVPSLKIFNMEDEHFDRLEWEDESVKFRLLAISKWRTIFVKNQDIAPFLPLTARTWQNFGPEERSSNSKSASRSQFTDYVQKNGTLYQFFFFFFC